MANNKSNIKQKNTLNQYKAEAAKQVGVDLNDDNIKAKDAGAVGGRMVKNMIDKAKSQPK
ncbi:MAG: small, acid-soluble spore protein, alpha/beta type [Bacillota bacterium]|nr:small, acid-soluble spore protein, alpha/beta type [Bacillota bacterium]